MIAERNATSSSAIGSWQAVPRLRLRLSVHKHGKLYCLSYACDFPERTAYATAEKITGPWTFRGVIKERAGNCNTNHQAIIDHKGKSYFIYHNGGTLQGSSFRRSVCIEYLHYNPDGNIQPIHETSEGIAPVQD